MEISNPSEPGRDGRRRVIPVTRTQRFRVSEQATVRQPTVRKVRRVPVSELPTVRRARVSQQPTVRTRKGGSELPTVRKVRVGQLALEPARQERRKAEGRSKKFVIANKRLINTSISRAERDWQMGPSSSASELFDALKPDAPG